MAEENNSDTTKPTQPVDIETMKVKLLIVCKDQGALDPVATFLNRRGWETQVVTKVKDALAAVTALNPDFVLVSANHPNPKLMKFPTILKTTFSIESIGFAEGSDGKSLNILQNLPVPYRINGILTGPSTQRRIKQILREIYLPESARAEPKSNAQEDAADEAEYVAIKGARESKTQIADYQTNQDDFDLDQIPLPVRAGETILLPDDPDDRPGVEKNNGRTIISEDFSLAPGELAEIVAGIKKDYPSNGTSDSKDNGPLSVASTTGREFSKQTEQISFFEKLLIKILNEVTEKKQETEYRIGNVERLVIVSVQSAVTNGYLVISSSATTRGLRELATEIRAGLADFLRQEGKVFEFGIPALVVCSDHDFFSKVDGSVEFIRVANVADGEIAVKFLAAPQPLPRLHKVPDTDKCAVDAQETPPDRLVDFKLYIHLEKNMRYVVLVKEGGTLSAKYKERLKEFNKGLFIDELDADKFKRFFSTAAALDLLKVKSYRVEYAEPLKKAAAAA